MQTGIFNDRFYYLVDWKNKSTTISNDALLLTSAPHIKLYQDQLKVSDRTPTEFTIIFDLETEALITRKHNCEVLPKITEAYISVVRTIDIKNNNFLQQKRVYLNSINTPNDLIDYLFITSLVRLVNCYNNDVVICAFNGVSFDFKFILALAFKYQIDCSHFKFIDPFINNLRLGHCFKNNYITSKLLKDYEDSMLDEPNPNTKTTMKKISTNYIIKKHQHNKTMYRLHLTSLLENTHSPDSDVEMTFITLNHNFLPNKVILYDDLLSFYATTKYDTTFNKGIEYFVKTLNVHSYETT